MILNFKRPGPSMTHDFETFTDYLNEEGAFDNEHLHEWPASRNPFLDRMASQLKPGFASRLSLKDFTSLVAGATTQWPDTVIDFSVTADLDAQSDLQIAFTVKQLTARGNVPLTADNSGFFCYAMNWMAHHRPGFDVSVYGSEFFWIHVAQ